MAAVTPPPVEPSERTTSGLAELQVDAPRDGHVALERSESGLAVVQEDDGVEDNEDDEPPELEPVDTWSWTGTIAASTIRGAFDQPSPCQPQTQYEGEDIRDRSRRIQEQLLLDRHALYLAIKAQDVLFRLENSENRRSGAKTRVVEAYAREYALPPNETIEWRWKMPTYDLVEPGVGAEDGAAARVKAKL
ncbi:unnamed protein product [Peniophora sp. CBMAI 1063]|nr:unnamed protein product [Peniophora sp. CBMAI 1063]